MFGFKGEINSKKGMYGTRQCFSRALIYRKMKREILFLDPSFDLENSLYYGISKSHHRGLGQSLSDSDR